MRTAPLRRAPKGVLRGCAKGVPGGVTLRSRYPKRPVSASSACTSATATPPAQSAAPGTSPPVSW